nr:hypothetical protein [Tanacetum cinerariifolium]
MFVVKAATNKIGATLAHNLLCSMKGGYEYVHGTIDDFKNHQRDVNVIIGESDAQILINKMENKKMYVPNFTFQYRVENSELVTMFWADEVAKRFDKIVWNMFIEPLKFEEKWSALIEDFGLQSHKWLTKMFNLREIWITAYFIDSSLYGLMRTTSRSESENSFFKSFTSPGATLVSFMMSYESVMERKRYRQEVLDFKTIEATPKYETKLEIELHAARVYTRTIFLLVQTKINEGCWNCTIQDLKIDEGYETVIIRDKKPNDNRSLFHKKGKEQEKKTEIVGEIARDYKNRDINVIPKQYILRCGQGT